ncbi:tyrosine protein kinase [Nocardia sp. NPDC059246]|uniref:DUF7064 domain-containing protein n=1 Tax=unclassified Nocardia TaxID=2637762 RepID=UPI0036B355F4
MSFTIQDPAADLWIPIPENADRIDPHTIHTHYFGFSVPEAALGGFLYIRYQPAFSLCQGGVVIFRGLDNVEILDVEHLNWENTMRWPTVEGTTITTPNGLSIEFLELGKTARLRYEGSGASFDLLQTAVSPLAARSHVMPGEAENADPTSLPGGLEQFMHCTGTLTLHGQEYAVDCYAPRDRSWNQVRTERHDSVNMPPIAWSPICFGPDFGFNQIGWEHPDTDPPYLPAYPVPADRPTHVYGWVYADGVTSHLATVRRTTHERHPVSHLATRMTIEASDELGRDFRFEGTALALAPVPAWPNISLHDAVFRWEDEFGRVGYATCQEAWFDKYQRLMNASAKGRFARLERNA